MSFISTSWIGLCNGNYFNTKILVDRWACRRGNWFMIWRVSRVSFAGGEVKREILHRKS